MQICRELAGFSFGQADNVRRAMSKKKHAVMEAEREHFVHGCTEPGHECPGCVANGISEKVANEIYDEMSSFLRLTPSIRAMRPAMPMWHSKQPISSAITRASLWRP